MGAAKKNEWSIPRTASCLSQIHSLKNLDTVTGLISRHHKTGNVFIHLTGDTGLTLYGSMPKRFQQYFVGAFKRYPKAIVGITKSHLLVHTIKILEKYGLVGVLMPFIALALILSVLPKHVVWFILICSVGYLILSIIRKFKS